MRLQVTVRGRPPTLAASSCLLLCSTLFLSGCGAFLGSSGSCAQVGPTVEPSRAAPGEVFVLSGEGFGGGCKDSNMPEWPDPSQRNILIEMRQGGKAWDLATVDAEGRPDYAIEATLEVPEDAEPGRAIVVANAAEEVGDGDAYIPLEVPFEVLEGRPG